MVSDHFELSSKSLGLSLSRLTARTTLLDVAVFAVCASSSWRSCWIRFLCRSRSAALAHSLCNFSVTDWFAGEGPSLGAAGNRRR